MPITAGVRPGLKPRAESASPLKGAVRRPGARVDRLGAGAVGISRLQPAWGVSPAVHGRAIEDTAARLICAACRARRVGHAESPRHRRGGRGAASPLQGWGGHLQFDTDLPRWGGIPRPVGVRRCLTRRPGRAGNRWVGRWAWWRADQRRGRCMPPGVGRIAGAAGEARLASTSAPCPRRVSSSHEGAGQPPVLEQRTLLSRHTWKTSQEEHRARC
jgi:hypothetical protein